MKLTAVLKRKRLRHRAHAGRVERQDALQAQQQVEDQEAGDVEEEHGDGIGQPVLLALLVDAADRGRAPPRPAAGPATGTCARR